MNKLAALILALILTLGLGLFAGYRLAGWQTHLSSAPERKPLYYRHPMNPKVTSATPAKDEMGMDYLPVYAEDATPTAAPEKGRILYYRHPMGAADTSMTPKKDEMGMDYIPVYESEIGHTRQLSISAEKIQKLGVRSEPVGKRSLIRTLRTLGTIQVDERRLHAVTTKFEGWVQRLHVNATGQAVKRGEPLLDIDSPDLLTAQQEYLIARRGMAALSESSAQARSTAQQLAENALQRLRYWDIGPAQLQALQSREAPLEALTLNAPVSGVVLEKPAQEGMRFTPGEVLFRIADLSRVWLLAEVFEQDVGWIRIGQGASISIDAYPDRYFEGRVDFIQPVLASETRTVRIRLELANAGGLLKPGMYGTAELKADAGGEAAVAVPESAVIDSGTRQIVLVQKGEGVFEPRRVKLGRLADSYFEILEGVEAGETVVTGANFLIDAESNLKSALDSPSAGKTDSTQEGH
ncbi:MAG: efflux RND transporter periplasmic adaptor subunit [Methylococcaceae bacterium]|nr:efflux RND transporter periplasmic adaptor subunit [Methylococcaceae bacterium]